MIFTCFSKLITFFDSVFEHEMEDPVECDDHGHDHGVDHAHDHGVDHGHDHGDDHGDDLEDEYKHLPYPRECNEQWEEKH